jgi:hypothetical protein
MGRRGFVRKRKRYLGLLKQERHAWSKGQKIKGGRAKSKNNQKPDKRR